MRGGEYEGKGPAWWVWMAGWEEGAGRARAQRGAERRRAHPLHRAPALRGLAAAELPKPHLPHSHAYLRPPASIATSSAARRSVHSVLVGLESRRFRSTTREGTSLPRVLRLHTGGGDSGGGASGRRGREKRGGGERRCLKARGGGKGGEGDACSRARRWPSQRPPQAGQRRRRRRVRGRRRMQGRRHGRRSRRARQDGRDGDELGVRREARRGAQLELEQRARAWRGQGR